MFTSTSPCIVKLASPGPRRFGTYDLQGHRRPDASGHVHGWDDYSYGLIGSHHVQVLLQFVTYQRHELMLTVRRAV